MARTNWGLEKGRDLLQIKRQIKAGTMSRQAGLKLTRQIKPIKDAENYYDFWFKYGGK